MTGPGSRPDLPASSSAGGRYTAPLSLEAPPLVPPPSLLRPFLTRLLTLLPLFLTLAVLTVFFFLPSGLSI